MKKMLAFPDLRQYSSYDCGANAIQSVLAYYGLNVREDRIVKIAGSTAKIGTEPEGFEKIARKFGFKCRIEQMTIRDLKKSIDKKQPVVLLLQAYPDKKVLNWEKTWHTGHYAVAIGYDSKKIYFEDPSSMCRTYLSFKELDKRWHDKDAFGKKYEHAGIIFAG
ncbi:MAG: cysteine peptidase family C39 domain-containing protein [Candidatus Nanoarchaeia archaeon]|nr:cysteine peptidase family C39 domain-containing protein [Candidatus Nanoarchaeia archaeon]